MLVYWEDITEANIFWFNDFTRDSLYSLGPPSSLSFCDNEDDKVRIAIDLFHAFDAEDKQSIDLVAYFTSGMVHSEDIRDKYLGTKIIQYMMYSCPDRRMRPTIPSGLVMDFLKEHILRDDSSQNGYDQTKIAVLKSRFQDQERLDFINYYYPKKEGSK